MFCLLCLRKSVSILNIFVDQFNYNPMDIIPKYFWITPSQDAANICFNCWDSIQTFHSFYTKIENAHTVLDTVEVNIGICPNNIKTEQILFKKEIDSDSELTPEIPNSDFELTTKEEASKISKDEVLKPEIMIDKLNPTKVSDEKIATFVTLSCDICQIVLPNFRILKKHFSNEHKVKGFVRCCSRKYFGRNSLADHINTHINPQHFSCTTCSKIFTNRESYRLHIKRTHIEPKKFQCEKCLKYFSKKQTLISHMNTHAPVTERKFICKYDECNKSYTRQDALYLHHHRVHKNPTKKVCDLCGKSIATGRFREHQLKHNGVVIPKSQCHICNALVHKKYLRYHLESHESNTDYYCTTCGKKYPNSKALYKHVYEVHRIKKTIHPCAICQKEFKSLDLLRQHMPVHTDENNFICNYCSRAFKFKSNVYDHKKKEHPIEHEQEKLNHANKKIAKKNYLPK